MSGRRRGPCPEIHGHVVDLLHAQSEFVREDVERAIADFTTHRAMIEQVKGMLVQLLSIAGDVALVRP